MLAVTAKVRDTGCKFAEANDSFASLLGREIRFSERTYPIAYDLGVIPTMTTLKSAHYLSRVGVKSGMHYIVHVYNSNEVYEIIKLVACPAVFAVQSPAAALIAAYTESAV